MLLASGNNLFKIVGQTRSNITQYILHLPPIRIVTLCSLPSLVVLSRECTFPLQNAVPTLCPKSYGHGQFQDSKGISFLVTDFLDLTGGRGRGGGSGMSLAQKMAKLHTTPAPAPEGFDKPLFGFPATTCCGDTPQPNDYKSSWADFFAENRLRFILTQCEKNNGKDSKD